MDERVLERLIGVSALLGLVAALGLVYALKRPARPASSAAGPAGAVLTPGSPQEPGAASAGGAEGTGLAGGQARGGGVGRMQGRTSSSGVSTGTVVVGAIFTESGALDLKPAEDSVRAYFNLVNEAGGVYGRKIQLVSCDDGFDATRGKQCTRRLVEQDKVFAIVGWLAPNTEPEATPYFVQAGVPVVGGLGVPQQFTSNLVFPTMSNLVHAAGAVVRFGAQEGTKRPAVVIADLPYAPEIKKAMEVAFARYGMTPTDVDIVSTTHPDYTPYVVKWRMHGADSVWPMTDPMSIVRVIQAVKRQNWTVPIYGPGLGDTQVVQALGPAMLEGAISFESHLVFDARPTHPGLNRYVSAMRRYFPQDHLVSWAEISWDAAKVFVEGLRRAGPNPSREALVNALNTLTDFEVDLGPPHTYRPGPHDPLRCVDVIRFKDGRFRPLYRRWQCWDWDEKAFFPVPREGPLIPG